jgi:hypothetical protein
MAKISEMEPAAAGAELYRQYMSAHDAWLADKDVRHPSFDTKEWRSVARDAGTLREPTADDANAGLGPVEIERTDHGADNPDFEGKPANPTLGKPAQDAARAAEATEEARIRQTGSANLEGDLWAARVRRSNPETVRKMSLAIKGFDRLK